MMAFIPRKEIIMINVIISKVTEIAANKTVQYIAAGVGAAGAAYGAKKLYDHFTKDEVEEAKEKVDAAVAAAKEATVEATDAAASNAEKALDKAEQIAEGAIDKLTKIFSKKEEVSPELKALNEMLKNIPAESRESFLSDVGNMVKKINEATAEVKAAAETATSTEAPTQSETSKEEKKEG